ncbi:MAG: TerB family tellurite resistance protein [Deltaproteobacteria bacterium]|nr:TerB family tellurite resistance protein [Deltaproteobacteria bacterium]
MIDLVKRFFSQHSDDVLKKNDVSHDICMAACALLLEMAHIDNEFSESESDKIISILKKDFDLSEQYANELIRKTEEELQGSIDLWQFTNLINQNYSMEEKIRIIEMVWKIAYSDGKLDKHEDYLVHKLANLLRLTHKQLIDVKLQVLKHLEKRASVP